MAAKSHTVPVYFWEANIINAQGGFDLVDNFAPPLWTDSTGAPAPVRGAFIHHYKVDKDYSAFNSAFTHGPFPQNVEDTQSFVVIEASTSYQLHPDGLRHRIDVFVERIAFNWPDLVKLQAQRDQEAADATA